MFGSIFYIIALDKIGLSKSTQWKNLQGPVGSILILFILSEFISMSFIWLILSIVLIFVSAIFFTITSGESKKINFIGVLYAVISAVFFGFVALLQKYVTNCGFIYSQQIYFSFFVFFTALICVLITQKKLPNFNSIYTKDNSLAILSGFLYFFASFFSVLAYQLIPGSIAFTLVQLNTVWTILAGILIFKEIKFKKHWLRIILGFVFVLLGIASLLCAQLL